MKNPTITYQEVFNKLCELNEQRSGSDYKFNWISKAEFNNIIKQLNNLSNLDKLGNSTSSEAGVTEAVEQGEATTIYNVSCENTVLQQAIDYSSEDDQISEFKLSDNDE